MANLFVRRATQDDAKLVNDLIDANDVSTKERWGEVEVDECIEMSLFSVVVLDGSRLVGFASFSQFCPDKGRTTDLWLDFITNKEICVANLLWLTYFVVDPMYEMEVTEQVMRTTFNTIPRLDFVLLVSAIETPPFFIHDVFVSLKLAQGEPSGGQTNILSCHRDFYLSSFTVRLARVDDHDDLNPIFKKQVDYLQDTYGEFFVADLIGAQDEENKALVAEVEGKAVGLLALSSDIDVTLLQQCFDLESYNELIRHKTVVVKEDPVLRDPVLFLLADGVLDSLRVEVDNEGIGTEIPSNSEEDDEDEDEDEDSPPPEFGIKWDALRATIEAKVADSDWTHLNIPIMVMDLAKLLKEERWLTEESIQELKEAEETGLAANAGKVWSWSELLEVLTKYKNCRVLWKSWFYDRSKDKCKNVVKKLPENATTKDLYEYIMNSGPDSAENKATLKGILESAFLPDDEEMKELADMELIENVLNLYAIEMRSVSIRNWAPKGGLRISVTGPPKAGTSTVAARVASELNLPCLELNAVLEAASQDPEDERSVKLKEMIDAGEVPNDIAAKWMMERLAALDCANGYVLDGFPTKNSQQREFEKAGIVLDKILVLKVSDAMVLAGHTGEKIAPESDLSKWRMDFGNVEMSEDKRKEGSRVASCKLKVNTSEVAAISLTLANLDRWLDPPDKPPKTEVLELCNAFAITLFCLDDAFESRAADFLDIAFDLFPEIDFCIITMPPTASESTLLRHFSVPKSRPNNTFSHVMYAMHRHALLGIHDITVSRLGSSEVDIALSTITNNAQMNQVPFSESMKESARKRLLKAISLENVALIDSPSVVAFKAECVGQHIATIVINSSLTDSESKCQNLAENFCVEDVACTKFHKPLQQATLIDFSINPIFQKQSRYILQEIMRQAKKTIIYIHSDPNSVSSALLAPVVSEFVQVKPQLAAQSNPSQLVALHEANVAKGDKADVEVVNFALYILPQCLLSKPKQTNNTRIVVVGASDCGIAVLEALNLVRHTQFTNLKLISPSGLPQGQPSVHELGNNFVELLHPRSLYSEIELGQLGLSNQVTTIPKKVVAIDRSASCVVIPAANQAVEDMVPYDILILTTGLQDCTDTIIGYDVELPEGVHFLTHAATANCAATAIEYAATHQNKTIVYGGSLRALESIDALIRAGLNPNCISWVYQKLPECLKSPDFIKELLFSRLDKMGVQYFGGMCIERLNGNNEGNLISCVFVPEKEGQMLNKSELSILMESSRQAKNKVVAENNLETTIPASLMLCASKPDVDADIFDAVNECGLVYDGRLVVDGNFQTVDSKIYSAGTGVKFSRRLRPKFRQEKYNSRELGAKLATAVLSSLDSTIAHQNVDGLKLPSFQEPKVVQSILPGRLHFARVGVHEIDKPFRSLVTMTKKNSEGADDDNEISYCQVLLDRNQRIAEILCVTSMPVEVRNLSRLVGIHESFTNSMVYKYDRGKIEDFVSFFRQDWCAALYHPRFPLFYRNLQKMISRDSGLEHILEDMKKFLCSTEVIVADETKKSDSIRLRHQELIGVGGSTLDKITYSKIEQNILDFLKNNKGVLSKVYSI